MAARSELNESYVALFLLPLLDVPTGYESTGLGRRNECQTCSKDRVDCACKGVCSKDSIFLKETKDSKLKYGKLLFGHYSFDTFLMSTTNVDSSSKSLFISTLPYEATTVDLSTFFSAAGPLDSCFVITREGKSTGTGIVTYAIAADATSALVSLKKALFMGKRSIRMSFALKKSVAVSRKLGIL